jgi:hypothetical protein
MFLMSFKIEMGLSFGYRQWHLVLQAIKGGNAYQASYPNSQRETEIESRA